MTYLVDANVLCEPTKPMPNEKVVEWLRAMNEISSWIPSSSASCASGFSRFSVGRKRARLEQWFEAVVRTIACVPWDAAVSPHRMR